MSSEAANSERRTAGVNGVKRGSDATDDDGSVAGGSNHKRTKRDEGGVRLE